MRSANMELSRRRKRDQMHGANDEAHISLLARLKEKRKNKSVMQTLCIDPIPSPHTNANSSSHRRHLRHEGQMTAPESEISV
jgi:hypothetical protein